MNTKSFGQNVKVMLSLVSAVWLVACTGEQPVVTDVCGGCPSVDRPICDPRMKLCVPCGGAFDEPACAARNQGTPYCALSGNKAGACVACTRGTQTIDCKDSAFPVCGDDGSCRKCTAHQECASGACGEDGACVAPEKIAYVNNTKSECSDAPHQSTPIAPFCDIQAAISMSQYTTVVVTGSKKSYRAIKVDDREKLSFIGPGRYATPTAKIENPSGFVAEVRSENVVGRISFDGFEFTGRSGLVAYLPTGSFLTVRRSHFYNIGQKIAADWDKTTAIIAFTAALIDGNEIGPGNYAALRFANGAVVTNNVIHHNRGSAAVTTFGGRMAYNTLVSNKNVETQIDYYAPFQIDCQKPTLVENSIVLDGVDGTDWLPKECNAHNVVAATISRPAGAGMILLDPVWLSGSLYKPDVHAPTTMRLVDTAGATDLVVDHDVDGNPRPQGKGNDIGAYELM